jgi:cell shape-determining protein MreC
MEKIKKDFEEKKVYHSWIYVSLVFINVLAFIGIFLSIFIDKFSCKSIVYISVFLIVFITVALLFWKVFKKISEQDEKRKEYNRKISWEEFQHELHKLKESSEQVKNLEKEKEELKKELSEYKDFAIAEREKNAQVFYLLFLELSNQNICSDSETLEEKLKRLEKDYALLKEKMINIKL